MISDTAILHEMKTAGMFLDAQTRFEGIEGYLHPLEGFALMRLAASGDGLGRIVEIGSFMGRSTCWLAFGSKAAGRERVAAVDHFTGSPEHQEGQPWQCDAIVSEGTTFNRFKANIERAGVADWVEPIVKSSEAAAVGWSEPIRLLFIDGDHSYEETQRDFQRWGPHLAERGYIAFHDVGSWEGVTRFYGDFVKATSQFREVLCVNSLRVVQRVDAPAASARKTA